MVYGATLGDYIGSRFEWHNIKTKNFNLFDNRCHPTDDTIMTLAVQEACERIKSECCNDERAKEIFVECMQSWGRVFQHVGYGKSFKAWIFNPNPKPYNSWGNGSAMRVSPIAWAFNTLKDVEHYAALSSEVTHNHPEGIKGAVTTAGCIFLARTGVNKHAIKKYVMSKGYRLKFNFMVRKNYRFDVSCMGTIPVAVESFLESKNFEDAIRNAISMGGDSDTIGAITGSIAEAFYGVPTELKNKADKILERIYATKNNWCDDPDL